MRWGIFLHQNLLRKPPWKSPIHTSSKIYSTTSHWPYPWKNTQTTGFLHRKLSKHHQNSPKTLHLSGYHHHHHSAIPNTLPRTTVLVQSMEATNFWALVCFPFDGGWDYNLHQSSWKPHNNPKKVTKSKAHERFENWSNIKFWPADNGSQPWSFTWYQRVSQFFEGAIEDQEEGFLPGMLLHLQSPGTIAEVKWKGIYTSSSLNRPNSPPLKEYTIWKLICQMLITHITN